MKRPMKAPAPRQPAIPIVPFLAAASTHLSVREREQLLSIATECRVPRHALVFERGDFADAVFSIIEGVARSWRPMPGGPRHIVAFLLQHDLLGLARLGRYVNTVEAVTPLKLYRFPVEPLTAMLRGNPELQFRVLCRVTQELRESQRRGAIAARRDLNGRVAMLLLMMEESQSGAPKRRSTISLPLTAVDIGEFVSAPGADVTRALHELEQLGILKREGPSTIRVIDRSRFESLAAR
jgi:CRP/FNR family transcriptional regulator, anaerobic regulatory protein